MRRSIYSAFKIVTSTQIPSPLAIPLATLWPFIRSFVQLASASLFLLASGCKEQSYDISNKVSVPDALNTAEVRSPSLSITYPESNSGDSSAFIQVAENSATITKVNAQDIPGSKLIYRLQDGEDMNKVTIDEKTGALSFKELPDWEKPQDADSNNNYMVLWQVLSSTGEARSQFLVIQVTDLPD
jgi:hypothetical protein